MTEQIEQEGTGQDRIGSNKIDQDQTKSNRIK